jgi:hypothetical protein
MIADEDQAVLQWAFDYAGPAADAEKLLKPFDAIEAVHVSSRDEITYPNLVGVEFPDCPQAERVISSALMLEYNVTIERTLYNLFNQKIAQYPELAPTAHLMHDGYATAGTKAIPSESTAYPHREENLLVSVVPSPPLPARAMGTLRLVDANR